MSDKDSISGNGVKVKFGPNLVKAILALAVLLAVAMGDSYAIPQFMP